MAKTKTAHQFSLCKHEWERHPSKGGLWQCVKCQQVEVSRPTRKRPVKAEAAPELPFA